MDRLPQPLYLHPSMVSFGIRLLLESNVSDDSNVNKSSSLLNKFYEEIVSIHYGNDRIETINFHCLKHFCDKVKRLGPLYCYSAMCFEAANRVLGDMFSGSHSELEVICCRVLKRHKLSHAEIENEQLKNVLDKLNGNFVSTEEIYSDEFIETQAVQEGKKLYPAAEFSNRVLFKGVYFDCEAY